MCYLEGSYPTLPAGDEHKEDNTIFYSSARGHQWNTYPLPGGLGEEEPHSVQQGQAQGPALREE